MGKNLDIWLAFLAAIFGGVGLKVIESLLTRKQKSQDLVSKLLDQSQKEISDLKAEFRVKESEWQKRVDEKEAEANEWQDKYWTLRETQGKS